MSHSQQVCQFGTVHAQCRCPSPNKSTVRIDCPTPELCVVKQPSQEAAQSQSAPSESQIGSLYGRRPEVVSAIQWDGTNTDAVLAFCAKFNPVDAPTKHPTQPILREDRLLVWITASSYWRRVVPGMWLVAKTGTREGVGVLLPKVFDLLYESVQ